MEQLMPLPAAFTPLALTPVVAAGMASRSIGNAESLASEELSDSDLEHVVGGLARAWPDADGRGIWDADPSTQLR